MSIFLIKGVRFIPQCCLLPVIDNRLFKTKHVIIIEQHALIITVSISLIIFNVTEFQISDDNQFAIL